MAVPKGEFTEFIENLETVYSSKLSDWGIDADDVFKFEPTHIYSYPSLALIFQSCIPIRTDRIYYRYMLTAEVWMYYQQIDAEWQKEKLDDLVADIQKWTLKNQTMNGFSIMTDVRSSALFAVDKGTTLIAARFEVVTWKDLVDCTDVVAGG